MTASPARHPAWFDLPTTGSGPDSLPPLEGDAHAEVCVVGLGASGLEVVRRLAERGVDVLGIDAVGIAGGAAGANGGFLLAGLADFHHEAIRRHGRRRAVALYQATLEELERVFESDHGERTGSLRIAATPEEESDVRAHLDALRRDGLPAEAYDGPEGSGLLVPTDGVFHPVARCRELARRAGAAGAQLHAPTSARTVAPGRVVTDTGVITADRIVVAVDGGLEDLVPALRGRIETNRLQMLATAPAERVLTRPVYRRYGYDYVQQWSTGEVLLGGGRDVDQDVAGPPAPSPEVQRHLDAELERLGVGVPVTHRWAARAAFTSDRLPVCEEVMPGVLALGAYSGHGNLLGTLCAAVAASAAAGDGPMTLDAVHPG